MGFNGARKGRFQQPRDEVVAAIDVGTTKVVCVIAKYDDRGSIKVVGIGHQASHGLKNGSIVDMDAATQSIGAAVNAAEQMASVKVDAVLACLSGGFPASHMLTTEVVVPSHQVTEADMRHALQVHSHVNMPPEHAIIHAIPVNWAVDGNRGVDDPSGMFAEQLGVDLHVVTAATGAMRNLATCIHRCHLEVDAFVTAPYAAALGSLVEDEMQLGAACIDLGGGTTSVSVFFDGNMVFCDVLPVGGSHITVDVARGLTTPLAHAERMKTLHGSALATSDDREQIDVPQVGESDRTQVTQVPRSLLTGVIEPRVEEIFELVRGRLEASGYDKVAGRRVVLTGGTAQLQGIRELAQRVLDKQVRVGRPRPVPGLPEATSGAAYAAVVGLVTQAGRHRGEMGLVNDIEEDPQQGILGKIGDWFREYF